MKELIDEARRKGLWLHCAYQDLWFSPDELEAEQARGRFQWGPTNWELRDPEDKRRALLAKSEAVLAELKSLDRRRGKDA